MESLISQDYYSRTKNIYLYNIMPLDNIASVVKNGIVCFETARTLSHSSIALESVQARRDKVMVPNGLRLHQYANLYFTYNNPMLYKRKDEAEKLCILAIHANVLDIEGCVVADQNAATDWVRFYDPAEG